MGLKVGEGGGTKKGGHMSPLPPPPPPPRPASYARASYNTLHVRMLHVLTEVALKKICAVYSVAEQSFAARGQIYMCAPIGAVQIHL